MTRPFVLPARQALTAFWVPPKRASVQAVRFLSAYQQLVQFVRLFPVTGLFVQQVSIFRVTSALVARRAITAPVVLFPFSVPAAFTHHTTE